MKRNRQNFFYFGPFFALLLSNNPENQNFENNKKMLEISSFDTGVPEIMIICFAVPLIWRVTDVDIFVDFLFYSNTIVYNVSIKKHQ